MKIIHFINDSIIGGMYSNKYNEKGWDAKVLVAEPDDLINFVADINPEVVLTSILFHKKTDGKEIINKLKQNPKTKHVTIIGFDNLGDEIKDEIIKLGAHDYWKMAEHAPEELCQKLEKLISTN